jgi:hypothetical protein
MAAAQVSQTGWVKPEAAAAAGWIGKTSPGALASRAIKHATERAIAPSRARKTRGSAAWMRV